MDRLGLIHKSRSSKQLHECLSDQRFFIVSRPVFI